MGGHQYFSRKELYSLEWAVEFQYKPLVYLNYINCLDMMDACPYVVLFGSQLPARQKEITHTFPRRPNKTANHIAINSCPRLHAACLIPALHPFRAVRSSSREPRRRRWCWRRMHGGVRDPWRPRFLWCGCVTPVLGGGVQPDCADVRRDRLLQVVRLLHLSERETEWPNRAQPRSSSPAPAACTSTTTRPSSTTMQLTGNRVARSR
jgi:hypothetical protein